jgi:cyclohexanecarboxylate-CoA ligase
MSENRFDPAAHARSMRDSGFWVDKNFDEFLQQTIAATPGKLALLADRADRAEPRRFTYAELGDLISRAAAALKHIGIGPRDVISVQLPNWWEFAVIALAAFRVGAVVNPLMPIFREHELGYMLDFAETKLLIVPKLFRGFDHEAMALALQPKLPKLQHIIVVDGEGSNSFDQALLSGSDRLGPLPIGEIGPLPPDQMAVLMFQRRDALPQHPAGLQHCARRSLRPRR